MKKKGKKIFITFQKNDRTNKDYITMHDLKDIYKQLQEDITNRR
jgi:hypothetical protein